MRKCPLNIMYFQFAISRNISHDKTHFVCTRKSFCFTDSEVGLFILQLLLRLCSGILHVYLFLFVYRSFLRLQMFIFVHCHIFQFLFFFVYVTNNKLASLWTYICRILFTESFGIFGENCIFWKTIFQICKNLKQNTKYKWMKSWNLVFLYILSF